MSFNLFKSFISKESFCQVLETNDRKNVYVDRFKLLQESEVYRDWMQENKLEDVVLTPFSLVFDYEDIVGFIAILFYGEEMVETYTQTCCDC